MNAIIIALPIHEAAGIGGDPTHAEARERARGRPVMAWAIDDATGRPAARWLVPTPALESSGELAA